MVELTNSTAMFNNRKKEEEYSHWISFTDLVAGFMMIFIVVSLVALSQINPTEEKTTNPDYPVVDTLIDTLPPPGGGIYQVLIDVFRKELSGMDAVEIGDSATIRFTVNEDSKSPLFRPTEYRPTTYFRGVMDDAIPVFLEELYKIYKIPSDTLKIQEIRIEGHTDPAGDYIYNLNLSSNRALAVQKYLLKSKTLQGYDKTFRDFIEKNSIACGYSFSRTLGKNGAFVERDSKDVDYAKSRRVEFRILLEKK